MATLHHAGVTTRQRARGDVGYFAADIAGALAALEDGAKATGIWISDAAGVAGAGLATAAGAVESVQKR